MKGVYLCSQALYDHLIRSVLDREGIEYIPDLPPRVEITTRTGSDRTVRFVFNNDKEKTFTLFGEPCTLKPFEMKIV
ncbi:MAG: hypothetical protein J6C51_08495 [Clostridia bacterium]|nr:hypothetical protein [Clostridia bacterium]